MKNSIVPVLCALLILGLDSCKNIADEKATQETAQSQTEDTEVPLQSDQNSEPVYRYVMVPNGLSLRKDNTLDSEKLAGMPFRSEVVLLEEATEKPLEVEHIKGGMHKIQYDGKTGYAFSGFLSSLPMPQEEEEGTEAYIAKLKERFSGVTYESRPNDPDFHDGVTDTFTLPAASWHEAYYLVAAMQQFPKNLEFPSPAGSDLETIADPEKPKDAWDSFLTVTRKNNTLEKIEYSYRAEGFGYVVTIVRESEKLFRIEHLSFVD